MNTRKLRKVLLTLCSALLLVSLSVGMTIAYLTDTDAVTNTFTVGNVSITLNEAQVNTAGEPCKFVEKAKVDADGNPVLDENGNHVMETVEELVPYEDAERVTANTYKLYPNHTYTKDPTIITGETCDLAFLRVTVKFAGGVAVENLNLPMETIFTAKKEFAYNGESVIWNWQNKDAWNIVKSTSGNDVIYTLTAKDYIDKDTNPIVLFDTMTIPKELTGDQLAKLENMTMEIKAYAVQADGFSTADAAFSTAFPELWGTSSK